MNTTRCAFALVLAGPLVLAGCPANQGPNVDYDQDGWEDDLDCAPENPDIHPEADDPYGDGVDTDCDGFDGIDVDADGYPIVDEDYEGDYSTWDCNDANALINPGQPDSVSDGVDNNCDGIDGIDADADENASVESGGGDCDDADPDVHPGADDPYGDQVDQDCDGYDGVDTDGDGYPANVDPDDELYDCNDNDADVNPGIEEIPGDGIDQDCDGSDGDVVCTDTDQDGFDNCGADGLPGTWDTDEDCNDNNADVNPAAAESCDGEDTDCDGVVPANEADDDNDGAMICQGDCDDTDADVGPFDHDNDGFTGCGGLPDCDDTDPLLTPADQDGDGYSTCDNDCDDSLPSLNPADTDGDGYSTCDGDCSDFEAALNLDDVDNDGYSTCTGDCDDSDPGAYPADLDGDGWEACSGDCDDGDAAVHPGVQDLCNNVDDDCDGVTDEDGSNDVDLDGLSDCQGDCDDANPLVYLGAAELCDGLDNDCDGVVPVDEVDADGDGYLACEDCDDANPIIADGALELCDGVDNDCDGSIDEACVDCDRFVPTDHASIPEALTAAAVDDVICVEPGVYGGNLVIGGKDVHLVGLLGPPATILDGGGNDTVVTIQGGKGSGSILEGLTITGGSAWEGGGINITGTSPTLTRLHIHDNEATNRGGGIYVTGVAANPTLSDLTFTENTSESGGGICFFEVPGVTLTASYFQGNHATNIGGALCVESGSLTADDLVMIGNTADGTGAGIQVSEADFTGSNLLISGNLAPHGAGYDAWLTTTASATISNSTFVSNHADHDGGGARGTGTGMTFDNVLFENNTALQGNGGALAWSGDLEVHASNFVGNHAISGGAITIGDCNALVAGCLISGNTAQRGGGIYHTNGGTLTLTGVTVSANTVTGDYYSNEALGGGVLAYQTAFVASDVVFADNYTEGGGGACLASEATLDWDRVVVANNRADIEAGGVRMRDSESTFTNVVFVGNEAVDRAGAMMVKATGIDPDEPTLTNCLFAGNEADMGAAVYTEDDAQPAFIGTLFVDNVATADGGALYSDSGVATLRYNDVWNNQPDHYYGIADPTGLNGNQAVDPQLMNTAFPDPLDWDLHLGAGSPLIDTGDPAILDPDSSPSDIGLYGGPGADDWDLDQDGYFLWWQPGSYPGGNWDCDDLDAAVYPGSGC